MIEQNIKGIISRDKALISELKNGIRTGHRGNLIINRRHSKTYFYRNFNGQRRGISSDTDEVYRLARNEYIMARVELLKQESAIAEHLLLSTSKCIANSGINKIVDKFKRAGLDMCRVTRTERQLQHCGKQSENPYRPEDLIWKSNNGIFTRSKSERDFCNRLEAYGIPYQYEKRMVINVSGLDDMKGVQYYEGVPYKIIYPDFTIFLADGTILIIEHLGRVDSKDYRQRNGEKMIALLHSGIVDHDHLLITFEKDFRTPDIIDDYIERLILPYV